MKRGPETARRPSPNSAVQARQTGRYVIWNLRQMTTAHWVYQSDRKTRKGLPFFQPDRPSNNKSTSAFARQPISLRFSR